MNGVIEMIKQENIKIEPSVDFEIDKWLKSGGKFVLFFFDENSKRNRYSIESLKKYNDSHKLIDEWTYRGHIVVDGHGSIPLFEQGFKYPLYSVNLSYCITNMQKCSTEYLSISSPISFKLKDKEDRLCFDVMLKKYSDLTSLLNDSWSSRTLKKAYKVEIPDIN